MLYIRLCSFQKIDSAALLSAYIASSWQNVRERVLTVSR